MTTQPLRPPLPSHLQPTAKAPSVAKSSQLSAIANSTPLSSRSTSRVRPLEPRQNVDNTDATSDRATLSLIRRVLAPDISHGVDPRESPRPVDDFLPPLTSSNEIDTQLYAIIAIVMKEFVYAWYSKITPDHVFVEEVIQIIAHCSRAIEQRLRQVDVPELLVDEIPAVLNKHVLAYKIAVSSRSTSTYGSELARIYHALNPHPAMSPYPESLNEQSISKQQQSEATYRQLLVQGTLAVLLPTEDLENPCLRTLVGDIIADLILGQIFAGKICEAWFLHVAISKVIEVVRSRIEPKATGEELQNDTRSRLEKFGLLSSGDADHERHSSKKHQSLFSALFWRTMQYAYLATLFIWFILVEMFHARYIPPRTPHTQFGSTSSIASRSMDTKPPSFMNSSDRMPRPVLKYRISALISTLLDLSTRMPWLSSTIAFGGHLLTTGAWRLGGTNALFDKFLYNAISTRVLSPSLLPPLLLNFRRSVFPGNALGPRSTPPPSADECLKIRRQAAESILNLLPNSVARTYFAPKATAEAEIREEMLLQIEEGILDVFGDQYLNKHLIYGILELVLVRLIPELADKTPSELLAEREVGVEIGEDEKDAGKE